jgi:hypothetical protein
MASMIGSGLITRLWLTSFLLGNAQILQDLVLRFYWDGESQPSVECPLGSFFGVPFGRYTHYVTEPLSLTSGGFNCNFPMPYASGARLEIANEGARIIDPVFYNVAYYELDTPPDSPFRFHAQWRRENLTRPGVPYTVLDARGMGQYVGCHMFLQNREWWLRPPLAEIIFPRGVGMGMLEGQEHIWVDEEDEPSVVGTGTEDFFNSGWYFRTGTFSAPGHGCTVRNYITGRVAAYRFDVAAPVPFRRSLRFTLDHGFENQLATDYTSVAYWYQTEPHHPFDILPPVSARRLTSPLANIVQALLILGGPALAGALLMRKIRNS